MVLCCSLGTVWRLLQLHCRMLSLIILAIPICLVCGAVGAYFTIEDKFDIDHLDIAHNKTAVLQKTIEVAEWIYQTGGPRTAFTMWAICGLIIYLIILALYYVCACSQVWKRCSDYAGQMVEESVRHHPRHHHIDDSVELEHVSIAHDETRSRLRDYRDRHQQQHLHHHHVGTTSSDARADV